MRIFAQTFLIIAISAMPLVGWSVDLTDELPELIMDVATPEDEALPVLVVGPDFESPDMPQFVTLDDIETTVPQEDCTPSKDCRDDLQRRVRRLERLLHMRSYGLGMTLGVPTDGQFAYWAVEANYRWLYANYALGRGGGPGLKAELDFADRVHWQVIRLGVMFWHGEALSVTEVSRSWDIALGTSVGVRVWRGLMVTLGVNWYVPNPFDTSSWALRQSNRLANEAYEKELIDLLNKLDDALSGQAVDNSYASPANVPSSSDINKRVYHDALRQPNVLLGFYYEF